MEPMAHANLFASSFHCGASLSYQILGLLLWGFPPADCIAPMLQSCYSHVTEVKLGSTDRGSPQPTARGCWRLGLLRWRAAPGGTHARGAHVAGIGAGHQAAYPRAPEEDVHQHRHSPVRSGGSDRREEGSSQPDDDPCRARVRTNYRHFHRCRRKDLRHNAHHP